MLHRLAQSDCFNLHIVALKRHTYHLLFFNNAGLDVNTPCLNRTGMNNEVFCYQADELVFIRRCMVYPGLVDGW